MRWMIDTRNPVARSAWLFGLAVGLLRIAHELAVNALEPDALGAAPIGTVLLVGLVALFALAGWRGALTTGRLSSGLQAALGAAAVGSAIGMASLWVVTFAFIEMIRRDPGILQDFARSGGRDLDAFIVGDAVGASAVSLVASFVLGCGAGALGGLVGKAAAR